MKNKKGFTLIEIITAIVILGILMVITVPVFTGYLKGFREDYYKQLESSIQVSGQTFFTDNRNYRPEGLLESGSVKTGTLNNENYIEDVDDYNGNGCDLESYVIVIKEGRGKYRYESCLRCPQDNYQSNNPYCSEDWLTNGNLVYELGDAPVIYVYQGTPRSELKEKLKVKAWITKYDSKGNVLATVNGEEDDSGEVPYIYPLNMDSVDTSKLGEYPITYQYGDKTKQGKVIVYRNNSPLVSIQKDNNGVITPYNDLSVEQWGQRLIFDFNINDAYFDKAGTKLAVVQWRRAETKKWEDFCRSADGRTCHVDLRTEMNAEIEFRMVTDDSEYSDVITKKLRIDNTTPTVKMTISGTIGVEDWYRSNITYGFKQPDTKDNLGRVPEAISGIIKWGISTTNPTTDWNRSGLFNLGGITGTNTQTADTSGTTWYAYVEDRAGNRAVASHVAKKDTINPTCTVTSTGQKGTFDWYIGDATIVINRNDDRSTIYQYDLTLNAGASYNNNPQLKLTTDTKSITYYGYVKDKAGNINNCSHTIKRDTVAPSCALTLSGTMGNNNWYRTNVTISFSSVSDATSDVYQYGIGGFTEPRTKVQSTDTSSVTYTGQVKDYAGHTNSCSQTFKRDANSPTLTPNVGDGGVIDNNNGYDFGASCSDGYSGINMQPVSVHVSSPSKDKVVTFTCTDNAGNSTSQNYTYGVRYKSRSDACSCETWNKCEDSECGSYCSSYGWSPPSGNCDGCDSSGTADCTYGGCSSGSANCSASHQPAACSKVCNGYKNHSCRTSGCGCETYSECWHY